MGTAVDGGHIVGEGNDVLVVGIVILHRHLGGDIPLLRFHIDHVGVDSVASLGGVHMLHEGTDTALVAQIVHTGHHIAVFVFHELTGTLIPHGDADTGVEECLLTHTLQQIIVIKFDGFTENLTVRLEADVQTVLAHRVTLASKRTGDLSPLHTESVGLALVAVTHLHPFGEGVYNGGTYAVQTAGDLISAAAELTAGVEDHKYDLQSGAVLLRIEAGGNAAAVILYGHASVLVDGQSDGVTPSGHSLVDGVIHDFVHQVVQTAGTGSTDIHTGTFSYCIKTFEHLYLLVFVMIQHLILILHEIFPSLCDVR